MVETLALSAMGAAIGLAIAFWADRALMAAYIPADSGGLRISTLPEPPHPALHPRITLITGIAFRPRPRPANHPARRRPHAERAGRCRSWWQRPGWPEESLVVAQVSLSLLLLIGAGLFLRTLNNLSTLGPGFPIQRLIGFNIDPTLAGYKSDQIKIFYQHLTDTLSATPGVQSVSLAEMRILEDNEWDSSMTVEGYSPAKEGEHAEPYMNRISPGYFATLGVPVLNGRDFTLMTTRKFFAASAKKKDDWTPTTAIINETFARKYFAGRNPIGLHVGFGSDPGTPTPMEVIASSRTSSTPTFATISPSRPLSPTSVATTSAI